MDDQTATVFTKLAFLQKKVRAPKNQYNEFSRFNFRSTEDILDALKPHMDDCVITFDESIELIGERYYVKSTATIYASGGKHSVTALCRETESKKKFDQSQITGACTSYARKYALGSLLLLGNDDKEFDQVNNDVDFFEKIREAKTKDELHVVYEELKKVSGIGEGELKKLYAAVKVKVQAFNAGEAENDTD